MSGRVDSRLQTLEHLVQGKVALRIPSYQRPYVWPSDDVVKLLDDIVAAFDTQEPHYYIGTVLSSVHRKTCELIDGQQRMTTLMLLAMAFGKAHPTGKLAKLAVLNQQPRLTFAIREEVQALLAHWAGLGADPELSGDAIRDYEFLRPLYSAHKALTNGFARLLDTRSQEEMAKLSEFIYRNVKWVNNIVPHGSDLNRLFTTMNTAGVQLEQSDILKSALLKKMTQDSFRYDAIWQACENMGNYFERNVRKLFPQADWGTLTYDDLAVYSKLKFPLEKPQRGARQGKTIAELDTAPNITSKENLVRASVDDTDVYCRSTIGFPLLLIHAFRIFECRRTGLDIGTRVIDSQLNRCFAHFVKTAAEADVKAFLQCLWQVRYQFDRWVVKWVRQDEDGEEHLCLATVSRDKIKKRLSRRVQEMTDLVQLQSVRTFSGERSAQHWLTPFLGRLDDKKPVKQIEVERLLEDIDNQLSMTKQTQKEASFALIDGSCGKQMDINSVCDGLRQSKGTAFEHYWFQKLEYILWRRRATFHYFDQNKLSRYRITSKNSIEHVHPQKEKYDVSLADTNLHAFGNLVLLSPGENSSYSNKPVSVKQADFNSKPRYDALKLAHVFHTKGSGEWNVAAIGRHQKEMLRMLTEHYT